MAKSEGDEDTPHRTVGERPGFPEPDRDLLAGSALPGKVVKRVTAAVVTSDPYKWICSLETSFENSVKIVTDYATGFLVGPRLILTAAHNLYKPGYALTEVKAYRGRTEERTWLEETTATRFGCLDDWHECTRDIGWVMLDSDSNAGDFMDCAVAADVQPKHVNVAGYPLDYGRGILMRGFGECVEVRRDVAFYEVSTEPGQSGSPVWYFDSQKQVRLAIGVHNQGRPSHCIPDELMANMGSLITPEVMSAIRQLRGDAEA